MFKVLATLIFFVTSTNLYAARYLEPYLGANFSTFEEQFTDIHGTSNGVTINSQNAQAKGDFSGVTFGFRLYEKFLGQFILGGDAGLSIATGKINYNVLTKMGDYSIVTFTPGIIAGWDIPTILFPRIWAGFYPINSLSLTNDESTKSSDSDRYTGHSYKVGVSFDWWIQLGVEYASHTYSYANGSKLPRTVTVSGITMTEQKMKYDEFLVTLSYPFSL